MISKKSLSLLLTMFCMLSCLSKTINYISFVVEDTVLDNLKLTLISDPNIADNKKELNSQRFGHTFTFRFEIQKPCYIYFDIDKMNQTLFFIEPGDSVRVIVNKDTALFSGVGFEKYEFKFKMRQRNLNLANQFYWDNSADSFLLYKKYFSFLDSCKFSGLDKLEKCHDSLSYIAYTVLKTDLITEIEWKKMLRLFSLAMNSDKNKQEIARNLYSLWISNMREIIPSDTTALALNYSSFLWQMALLELQINHFYYEKNSSIKLLYSIINSLYDGLIKEKILTQILIFQMHKGIDKELEYCLEDYRNNIHNQRYKTIVENKFNFYKNILAAGKPANNFHLPDISGKYYKLSDFKDKVVLLDFWFYGCSGCLQLSKTMKPVIDRFRGNPNVVFVTISVDKNRERWIKGIADYVLSHSINLYTECQGETHPVIQAYNVFGYPLLFLIDKEGKIYSSNPPDPKNDNGKPLIELIFQALK